MGYCCGYWLQSVYLQIEGVLCGILLWIILVILCVLTDRGECCVGYCCGSGCWFLVIQFPSSLSEPLVGGDGNLG